MRPNRGGGGMSVTYKLWRTQLHEEYTLGTVTGPGLIPALYSMEDAVREVPGQPVAAWKVKGKTAIPSGIYRLRWTMSQRFGREMLLLEGVDGFAGIRIHAGNTEADTEGCILLGKRQVEEGGRIRITDSRSAVAAFEAEVVPQIKAGKAVFLEVE